MDHLAEADESQCGHPNCAEHGKSPCEGVGCDGMDAEERAVSRAAEAADRADRADRATRAVALTPAQVVANEYEAYLSSPSLNPAWIAGWHAAINHATAVLVRRDADLAGSVDT